MATVVVAFDGTRVNSSDTNTNWGNFRGAGGAPASENQLAYQGTAVNKKVTSTTQREGVDYDPGAGALDMWLPANRLWFVKGIASDSFDLNTTWGSEASLGSSNANFFGYNVAGSGTNRSVYTVYPPQGGYLITAIDPRIVAWRESTDGTPDLTAIDWFGWACQFATGTAKNENVALDAIDIGRGLIIYAGDGASTDGDYAALIAADQGTDSATAPGRVGVVTSPGPGLMFAHGLIQHGRSSEATEFTDSDTIIVFPDGYHSAGSIGLVFNIQNASTVITQGGLSIGQGLTTTHDTRPDYRVVGTSGTAALDGSTIQGFRLVHLTGSASMTGATIVGSGQVNPVNENHGGFQTLDGTGDYLDSSAAVTNTFTNGDYTIICWVRPSDWTPAASQTIFHWIDTGNSHDIELEHLTTGVLRLNWTGSGGGPSQFSSTNFSTAGPRIPDGYGCWIKVELDASVAQADFYYSLEKENATPQDIVWVAHGSPTAATRTMTGSASGLARIGANNPGGAAGGAYTGDIAYVSMWDGLGTSSGQQIFSADWRTGADFTGTPPAQADKVRSFNWEENGDPAYTQGDNNSTAADLDGTTISFSTSYAASKWDVNLDPDGELDNITFAQSDANASGDVSNLVTAQTGSAGTSFATGSYTPSGAADTMLIATVTTRDIGVSVAAPSSVSGNGLTWTSRIAQVTSDTSVRMDVYTAPAEGATAGAFTANYGTSVDNVSICVDEVKETSGFIQAQSTTQSSTTTPIITMSPGPGNGQNIITGHLGGNVVSPGTVAPGTGWTELGDVGGNYKAQTQHSTNDTTCDWTTNSTATVSVGVLEFGRTENFGHAIEFGKNTPSSVTLTNPTFVGYFTANGDRASTFYNNSGKALTINLNSPTGNSSYLNGIGASTTVLSTVSLIINNVIPGSSVAIIARAGGPETAGDVLFAKPAIPTSFGYVELSGGATQENVSSVENVDVTSTSGDFEIIGYVRMTDWTPATAEVFCSQWDVTSTNRNFIFDETTDGRLRLRVVESGTETSLSSDSHGLTDATYGWIRVVYDQSAGQASFYTSTDPEDVDPTTVTWTARGTPTGTARTMDAAAKSIMIGAYDFSGAQDEIDGRIAYMTFWKDGTAFGTGQCVFEADWRTGPDFDGSDQRVDDFFDDITWQMSSGATYTTAATTLLTETFSYNYSSDQPVRVVVRKSSSATKYLPVSREETISNTGLDINISQRVDTIIAN